MLSVLFIAGFLHYYHTNKAVELFFDLTFFIPVLFLMGGIFGLFFFNFISYDLRFFTGAILGSSTWILYKNIE